jgi:TolA-binding protein
LIDKSKEDVADEVTELRLQITSLESEIRMLKGKNSQLQLDLQNRDV